MKRGAPAMLPFFLATCVAAFYYARYAVEDPNRFLALPALLGVAVVAWVANRWPEKAVACLPAFILLADTKFRWRDPTASLRGELDGQVMLELGLYALAGLIVAIATVRRSLRPYPSTLMEVVLFGGGLVAVGSVLWSSSPKFTLVRGTQLLIVYAVGRTLVLMHGPTGSIRALTRTIVPYVVLCTVSAILLPSTVLTYDEGDAINRFSWFGVWPTQAARFVALAGLLLLASYVYAPDSRHRRFLGVPTPLWVFPLGGLLVLTYSRTALVAFAVAVAALVAIKYLRLWKAALLVAVTAVVSLVFVNSAETLSALLQRGTESEGFLATVLFRGQSVEQLARLSNRVSLWDGVLQLFLDRPLLGYGYQGSRQFLLAIMPWAGHAHNALAQAALDLGILGTVPVLLGLGRILSPRHLRMAGPMSRVVEWRATVLALGLFLLIVSMSAESFVEPSFEALAFCLCVFSRERVREEVAAPARGRTRPAAPSALTVRELAGPGRPA
ncbi:MAG TPA: O-antigen ligase family protein [Gemmatimonadales bacterium]|nr:O-antigen ligase family protein [Gemmatimonadales bacterium]